MEMELEAVVEILRTQNEDENCYYHKESKDFFCFGDNFGYRMSASEQPKHSLQEHRQLVEAGNDAYIELPKCNETTRLKLMKMYMEKEGKKLKETSSLWVSTMLEEGFQYYQDVQLRGIAKDWCMMHDLTYVSDQSVIDERIKQYLERYDDGAMSMHDNDHRFQYADDIVMQILYLAKRNNYHDAQSMNREYDYSNFVSEEWISSLQNSSMIMDEEMLDHCFVVLCEYQKQFHDFDIRTQGDLWSDLARIYLVVYHNVEKCDAMFEELRDTYKEHASFVVYCWASLYFGLNHEHLLEIIEPTIAACDEDDPLKEGLTLLLKDAMNA